MAFPLREQVRDAISIRAGSGDTENFSVTIRAEKDLQYSKLEQVLNECRKAGNTKHQLLGRSAVSSGQLEFP